MRFFREERARQVVSNPIIRLTPENITQVDGWTQQQRDKMKAKRQAEGKETPEYQVDIIERNKDRDGHRAEYAVSVYLGIPFDTFSMLKGHGHHIDHEVFNIYGDLLGCDTKSMLWGTRTWGIRKAWRRYERKLKADYYICSQSFNEDNTEFLIVGYLSAKEIMELMGGLITVSPDIHFGGSWYNIPLSILHPIENIRNEQPLARL